MLRLTLGCGVPPGRRFLGIFEEDGEVGTVTYNNAVAVSHTGNTTETTLATVTIPGGLLQANSIIEIISWFGLVGGTGAGAEYKVYFGGTLLASTSGSPSGVLWETIVMCDNSLTAQKTPPKIITTDGSYAGTKITSAVDTTQDVAITFTGTCIETTDIVLLEGYRIKLNGV